VGSQRVEEDKRQETRNNRWNDNPSVNTKINGGVQNSKAFALRMNGADSSSEMVSVIESKKNSVVAECSSTLFGTSWLLCT
jgi:hypothetical protein